MRFGSLLIAGLLLGACSSEPEVADLRAETPTHVEDHAGSEAPAEESAATESQSFGVALDESLAVTALANIVASPDQFSGQTVKTEGEIARVCQRMGCWMELRTDADSPSVRVPMAGHAFFLPMDCGGRRATIQGVVRLEDLPEATREHLESEGAAPEATRARLSIEAAGVVLN